jgi:hypothetical protein
MSSPGKICTLLLLIICAPALCQTGFPFSDETLRYSINWPSGLSLGDASMSAHQTENGWTLEASADVSVPGFPLKDLYRSTVTSELCSLELTRDVLHGRKKTREKTTFDVKKGTARRTTLFPEGGGTSEFNIPSCARDALAFVYFARREMGQGRVAPAQQVFLGSGYNVRLEYTGAMNITVGEKAAVTDHVNISVKGPQANTTFEVFFARDAARTPLLIRIPLALGNISMELVR